MRKNQNLEYFWYDYETTGTRWFHDRIVQFAGVRTDADLVQIGETHHLYCKPQMDCLPEVKGWLTHGISVKTALNKGLTEHQFATEIHKLLTVRNTCIVAFNGLRFDHVMTRALFYRNLRDPYLWHSDRWLKNAKWDTLALFMAAHALRPDGIKFPEEDPVTGPSFTQSDLAKANDTQIGAAHDAEGDVRTMLALAQLIKEKQPKLFDYYVSLRNGRNVKRKVAGTFILVSGAFRKRPKKAAVMQYLMFDTSGNVYAFDLSVDPDSVLRGEELADGSEARDAIRRIKLNSAPFVVEVDLEKIRPHGMESWLDRLGLDLKTLRENQRKLKNHPKILDAVWPDRNVYEWGERDVDERLYDGFLSKQERHVLDQLLSTAHAQVTRWEERHYVDGRLPELVFRFRARNFPESLTAEDQARWYGHVRTKLFEKKDEAGRTEYERFTSEIAEQRQGETSERDLNLLDELEEYGKHLKARVGA